MIELRISLGVKGNYNFFGFVLLIIFDINNAYMNSISVLHNQKNHLDIIRAPYLNILLLGDGDENKNSTG